MDPDLRQFCLTQLADPRCGFSVGGFGALAEFQDDAVQLGTCASGALRANSAAGAIRIELRGGESALAYEMRSERENGWQYGVVIIGERTAFKLGGRSTLTELGADHGAITPADRDGIRFDLGVGLPHIEYGVRTNDAGLIATLRRHLGQRVIDKNHPLMETIIDASPPRVVCSAIARIEVYQRIDRHQTPSGPHTHLLPDLLLRRRTHSANVPIPAGAYPLLTVHPDNPLTDAHGRSRDFCQTAYAKFEALLECYGDTTYRTEKQRFKRAIERGEEPNDYVAASSRIGRLAQRIALRQAVHLGSGGATLERWRARFQA